MNTSARDKRGTLHKPFDSLWQKMLVAVVFPAEITGRMMFVDAKGFFQRSSNTIKMNCTANWAFYVSKAVSFVQGGVPYAEIARGRKILPDPHLFYFLSINFPPAFFFYINCHQCTDLFSKNELHLFCSISPTIIPFLIDVRKNKPQQFLLGMIFFYVVTVSRNTAWMILDLKQSVLTLWYSYGWLLADQYKLFHRCLHMEKQTCIKRRKSEYEIQKCTILYKKKR